MSESIESKPAVSAIYAGSMLRVQAMTKSIALTGDYPSAMKVSVYESFRDEAYPYLDELFSRAYLLVGNEDDAVNLVLSTYIRAFRRFEKIASNELFDEKFSEGVKPWLIDHLNSALCDLTLCQAAETVPQIGEKT